jgi:hypothetical protein
MRPALRAFAADEERGGEIGGEHAAPLLHIDVFQCQRALRQRRQRIVARRRHRAAGDVDQKIGCARLCREPLDVVGVGEIGDDDIAGGMNIGRDHLDVLGSQAQADRRADAARRAGDERALAAQSLKRHRRRR